MTAVVVDEVGSLRRPLAGFVYLLSCLISSGEQARLLKTVNHHARIAKSCMVETIGGIYIFWKRV